MTEKISIRAYEHDDRDWLVERHQSLYRSSDGFDDSFGPLVRHVLSEFEQSHDPESEAGWIAQHADTRLGSIFCVRQSSEIAQLRLFLLVPEERGRGLGAQLLATCMQFARARGYRGMTLWTHQSHEAACALYRKTGWHLDASVPVVSFGQDLIEQTWSFQF